MGLVRVVTSRLTWILVNHSLDCRFTRPTLHLFHALGVVLCYADKAVLSPHSMFTHLTVTDLTLGEEQCHSVSTPHRKAFSTCKSMVLCKSHVQIMTLFWANEVVVAFVACESCLFGAWKRHSTVKAIVFGCLFRKAVATLSELWDVPASADVLSSPIVIANPTFASCLVNLFITKTNTFCADLNQAKKTWYWDVLLNFIFSAVRALDLFMWTLWIRMDVKWTSWCSIDLDALMIVWCCHLLRDIRPLIIHLYIYFTCIVKILYNLEDFKRNIRK